jgi:hypothetical protein
MFVLIFYMTVGFNQVVLSSGNLDSFDTLIECVNKAEGMRLEMDNNQKIKYKCVQIAFSK